jgi:hypothetical protein
MSANREDAKCTGIRRESRRLVASLLANIRQDLLRQWLSGSSHEMFEHLEHKERTRQLIWFGGNDPINHLRSIDARYRHLSVADRNTCIRVAIYTVIFASENPDEFLPVFRRVDAAYHLAARLPPKPVLLACEFVFCGRCTRIVLPRTGKQPIATRAFILVVPHGDCDDRLIVHIYTETGRCVSGRRHRWVDTVIRCYGAMLIW